MTGKEWLLITGAGRGIDREDIVRSALAAGHAVVATGRNPRAGQRGARRSRGPAGHRPGRY